MAGEVATSGGKDRSRLLGKGSRRRFLIDSGGLAASMFLLGMGLTMHARQARALPPDAIRPPGALDETQFLGACLRCGLCVRACPYDTLSLAALGDRVALGTPYFTARDVPCEMCDDIPCVAACPSKALNKDLKNIDDARMGLAVLIDQENCLNFKGLRCDVCYRVCPRIDKAITLDSFPASRTFRCLYRVRQMREILRARSGRDQGAADLHCQGIAGYALPHGLGREGEAYYAIVARCY